MGVANGCGVPSRSAFIFDPRGLARYCSAHKSGIKFNTKELLRLVNAVKTSDRTGMAVPAGLKFGEDDLIPTEYSAKGKRKRKYDSTNTESEGLKKLFSDFQNTFEAFDKDKDDLGLKDGLVTLDEIRTHLLENGKVSQKMSLEKQMEIVTEKLMSELTEFKELVKLLPGKESESKINPDLVKVFEQFDSDHDGLISKEEVRSTLRAIGKDLSDTELDTCFNESDTNKDGKIDITEFSSFIAKLKQGGKLKDMPR